MDLKTFYNEMRADVDAFLAYWESHMKTEPEQYPVEMQPGEWHEQFLLFLSLKD
jgi:hypothetical protein